MWLDTIVYGSFYGNEYYKFLGDLFYGVNRDQYEELIGNREFLERISLDWLNKAFTTDTSTLEKITPLLDNIDDR